MVRLRLLGPIEVRAESDGPWTRPSPQQRHLLALLAAPPSQPRDAALLADTMWHGDPPPNANRLLQGLVSRLRAAMGQLHEGDGPLRTVAGGWRLDLAADDLDTLRFEQVLDRAGDRATATDLDGAGTLVDEALHLWRGRPFGDYADEPLVAGEVARLEERRLEALELGIRVRLAAGHHGVAIAELRELLVDQPLREGLWGLLMVALYRSGRQADALVAYQRVRERLVDELGVEPGPELRGLHQQILRHDLATGVGVVGSGPPPVQFDGLRGLPRARTALVGRTAELDLLTDVLAVHQVVTIVGLGGVGKTRLAVAAAEAAAPTVAQGGFVDLTRVSADRLVRAVATTLGVVERAHEPLVDTLVERLRRGPTLVVLDNVEHLLAEVGDLVERLTTAAPELVVLATSRERLGVPGEHVAAIEPLAVARVVRPSSVDDGGWAAPGAVDATASTRALAGSHALSDAAVMFLDRVRDTVPDVVADPGRLEAVCRRLDGLPLAIELAAARCASLGIDGLLAGLDDRLRLLTAAGGPARHRSLRAVLDWSHDLLDDDEQRSFRRLGVFTGSFDLAAATAVAAPGEVAIGPRPAATDVAARSRTADLVGRLADKSLVVHRDGADGSRWRLLDTVRDYALERLATDGDVRGVRRRYREWAVAEADHLRSRMDAGERWREVFHEVEADLRAALGTPDVDADRGWDAGVEGERLGLAFDVAALQARSGSYSSAQEAYATATALARVAGGPDDLARAALGASASGMLFGVSDRQRVDWLEEALAAQRDRPTAVRVRLLARLALELYWLVDRERSLELADEAIGLARRVGDAAAHAEALMALHYLTRGPEATAERLALSSEVVARAERGGATELALAGRAAHVVDLLAAGDLTGVEAQLGVLWEAAERLQRPAFQWYTDVYRLVLALLAGDFEDADTLATTAIAAGRQVAEFSVGLYFAEAITDLRDPGPALRRERGARFDELDRRFPGVLVWRCLGLLNELALVHPGSRSVTSPPLPAVRHDGVRRLRGRARRLADEVLDPTPRDAHWLVEACLLAEVAAELGDTHLATRLGQVLRPHAGGLAVAGRVGACRGGVSHALGLVRVVAGDLDGAILDLGDAVDLHDRLGMRPHLARSLSALAHALDQRGRDDDADGAEAARGRAAAIGQDLEPSGASPSVASASAAASTRRSTSVGADVPDHG